MAVNATEIFRISPSLFVSQILLVRSRGSHGSLCEDEIWVGAAALTRIGSLYEGAPGALDHASLFWEREASKYKTMMKAHSKRWVQLPVSPTAEQLTRVIFVAAQALLDATVKTNGDETARVHSVILHETETGYAQCFREDAYDAGMGEIALKKIVFSPQVKREWRDPKMWDKLLKGVKLANPRPALQIPLER